MIWLKLRHFLGATALAFMVVYGTAAGLTGSPLLDAAPAAAQTGGAVPGNFSGNLSDADLWRAIRKGIEGRSDMQDPMAGVLVQSEGDNWRAFKNGPLSQFGGWALAIVLIVLVVFRLIRGQVKIDSGTSGQTVERFNAIERATHWLTASSFIVLALSGRMTRADHFGALTQRVQDLVRAGRRKLVLELGAVSYMDSMCLGEIVSGLVTMRKQGGTLHLVNLTERVERLMTMVRLTSVFQTFGSEQEAVRSLVP